MTAISRLEAYGIPASAIGDKPLETTVLVHSVDDLRALLDNGLDEQGRQAHYAALFDGAKPAAADGGTDTAAGGASVVDRLAAHVFGNRGLSAADRAEIAPVFPLTMHVSVATGPLIIAGRYDLSTPDGQPRYAAFTEVTMLPGGYFVCENTPLTFTCDSLTREGDSGTGAADFNILGRTGAVPATPPTPPAAGQAASGSPGECSSAGIAGPGGGPGNPGLPGTPGTDGSPGGTGLPSMSATITIKQTLTASPLTVFSQSGVGGQGGNGGAGGSGQQGGNGGNGVTCDCTGNAGGPGGDGGPGGRGGRAGNGGNGVDAHGNVTIYVPTAADVPNVHYSTAVAPPGGPGLPGPGGPGGAGGAGSSGGKNNGGGSAGGTGNPGATGGQGVPGTLSGRPALITVGITP